MEAFRAAADGGDGVDESAGGWTGCCFVDAAARSRGPWRAVDGLGWHYAWGSLLVATSRSHCGEWRWRPGVDELRRRWRTGDGDDGCGSGRGSGFGSGCGWALERCWRRCSGCCWRWRWDVDGGAAVAAGGGGCCSDHRNWSLLHWWPGMEEEVSEVSGRNRNMTEMEERRWWCWCLCCYCERGRLVLVPAHASGNGNGVGSEHAQSVETQQAQSRSSWLGAVGAAQT
jgi:hypothetical protein